VEDFRDLAMGVMLLCIGVAVLVMAIQFGRDIRPILALREAELKQVGERLELDRKQYELSKVHWEREHDLRERELAESKRENDRNENDRGY
jgi:hypothetical protein